MTRIALAFILTLATLPAHALEPCEGSVVIRQPKDATCTGILAPSARIRELLTIERVELPAAKVELRTVRELHAAELKRVRAVAAADVKAAQGDSVANALAYTSLGVAIGGGLTALLIVLLRPQY
jgi:hypothetical protein